MSAIGRSLLRDERGFVISAELILISTVLVLGLVVALNAVKVAVAGELTDVAGAIGSLNQSYYTHGFHGRSANGGVKSRTYGSAFLDREDSTDEQEADFVTSVNTSCTTTAACPPAAPCVETPCATPPCEGTPVLPPAPCGPTPCGSVPCGTSPCGSTPCDTPCSTSNPPCGNGCGHSFSVGPCGTRTSPCGGSGSPCGGCGGGGADVRVWSGYGMSVPPVICPPGPAPFTGTDPFAPGAVSPENMLLQGISYGGVCAPPVAPPAVEIPQAAPDCPPPSPPAAGCPPVIPAAAACCEPQSSGMTEAPLPILAPAVVY